jgi:ParB-like chromosome segregation protein Spo0J
MNIQRIISFWTKTLAKMGPLSVPERIELINGLKQALHNVSPMKNEPVDCVLWVPADDVTANDYNPNAVAPPEMQLLEHSILEDGYTQPIVTFLREDKREVVDGFHRNRVGKESAPVRLRVQGYLPVVTINQERTDKADRIAATIRHNRARGKHRIDAMSSIVVELKRRNWTDKKIARELGMDADEVLRLYQISGLAELYANKEFSEAWEPEAFSETPLEQIEEDEADTNSPS